MKFYEFEMPPRGLCGTETLTAASAEELRVLVALTELGGRTNSAALAKAAGVSRPRAESAVAYFEGAGALRPRKADNIVEEFPPRLRVDLPAEESGEQTAATIRDENLRELLEQCADLLGKPALSDREIKDVVGLYQQYGLNEEYIVLLLSDMRAHSPKTSIRRMATKAIELCARDIDTPDRLTEYFRLRRQSGAWEFRLRGILGIPHRALTTEEKAAFRKWVETYDFGDDILTYAYDLTVRGSGEYNLSYMDKILGTWYKKGLRTLAECEGDHAAGKSTATKGTKGKKTESGFGAFDPEEAFRNALSRSFGDEIGKK